MGESLFVCVVGVSIHLSSKLMDVIGRPALQPPPIGGRAKNCVSMDLDL